jgi:hypothetical protein
VIVIYITDAREEYARTVFQELGLPAGARVRLRYSEVWIQPPLRNGLNSNHLVGRDALICYMDGNRGNLENAKAVACRYAQITKSERVTDFVSVECELRGFPSSPKLRDLFAAADNSGILSPGPRSGFFVVNADISSEEQLMNTGPDRWGSVARRMTKCSFFATASFLYCESFTNRRGERIVCQDGTFHFRAGETIRARIHTFAITNESRLHHYEIQVDDSCVETVDGPAILLTFGKEVFDVRLLAIPGGRPRPSLIRIGPGLGENGSFFAISIHVAPRRLAATIQRLAISLSGAAAATAGILPSTVPLGIRIALIITGSLALGFSARLGS